MDAELKLVEDELVHCIKCGFCRAVCPVFQSLGIESTVARGKMGLIDAVAEGAEVTEGFAEKMSLCLMCKACVENCPSGVKVDKAVMAARALSNRKKGLHWAKKLIFRGVLKPKRIMPLGMGLGAAFQGLFIKAADRPGAYSLRVPVVLDKRRVIPKLARRTLRSRAAAQVKTATPTSRKVAFFTGCLLNYVYADMGEAILQALGKLGVQVVVPKEQQCCGLPPLVNGDMQTAVQLAASNVRLFAQALEKEGAEAILVGCASCGSCMKHEWAETLTTAGPEYAQVAEVAKTIAPRIYDVSEYVVDILDIEHMGLTLKPQHRKVTYHDPCHLNRGQGVVDQPRRILKLIPGVEFVEMNDPGRCCGSGGSFSLIHYDLSIDINKVKADDIAGTGANAVVTGCPGCTMHMADGLHRQGFNQEVLHTFQLLNEALG